MADGIVVTAADANYFEFAKDAVESVIACRKNMALGFLDLGLNDEQRSWLRDRRVEIVAPKTMLDLPAGLNAQQRQMGYLARPFLREQFPGHETYVWLDADAWVQGRDGLDALMQGAARKGAAFVRQNEPSYRFWPWMVGWMHKHYVLGYGLVRGLWLAWQPMINNGVFAMRADAPHWEAWRLRYQGALTRTSVPAPHDQFSLNAAVYLDRLPAAFLPATDNWICDLATPVWNEEIGRFCSPREPFDPIHVLHLAGAAKETVFDIKTLAGGTMRRPLRRLPEDVER